MGVPTAFVDRTNNNADTGLRLADVNGDGLPDLVQGLQTTNGLAATTWFNTGSGWVQASTSWSVPTAFVDRTSNNADTGLRLADVNGDGLPDLVQGLQTTNGLAATTWFNTGSGWVQASTSWGVPTAFVDRTSNNADTGLRLADVNGDGLPDLVQGLQTTNGLAASTWSNANVQANDLSSITNPTGGQANFTYKGTPQYISGSNLLNPNLPIVFVTLSSQTRNDGLGTSAATTYAYGGGVYYYNGPYDRRLGGFNKITATDAVGNYTNTFFHTGSSTDSTHGAYNDSEAKIGKVYRTENYNSSNNLYAKQITRWGQIALGNNRYFVAASSTLSAQYDGSASHRDKAEAYTYDPTYGNIVQKTNYGEVSGNDDGTFSDTGSDLASTSVSYAASSTGYILALPQDELTQDQGSNKVRETRYYYDGLSLGGVNIGNETKTENWITGSAYASTTKVYDGTYGLVTQSRDADANLTKTTRKTCTSPPRQTLSIRRRATRTITSPARSKTPSIRIAAYS